MQGNDIGHRGTGRYAANINTGLSLHAANSKIAAKKRTPASQISPAKDAEVRQRTCWQNVLFCEARFSRLFLSDALN
jgi:hypothetical protein